MKKELSLSEYDPVCMLNLPVNRVEKPKFPVFDVHTHFGPLVLGENYAKAYDTERVVAELKSIGVTGVCNLELLWGDGLARQLEKLAGFEDFIHTFASVDLARVEEPGFGAHVDGALRAYKELGIKGLKLWKNLGLSIKDSGGRYMLPDDRRLRPIWDSAAKHGLPVLIHIADPKAFFAPPDRHNEYYECLQQNPEWSFCAPDLPSFEQLMEAQENLLADNPDTTFILAHVGSCAEDLGFVSGQLDRHPNMHIDIAARINELGRQPYTAREFFLRHQDRILFGTDYSCFDVREIYPYYFRFLETFDEHFRYGPEDGGYDMGRWNIYGIGLPDDVLKKLYADNAMRLLGLCKGGKV